MYRSYLWIAFAALTIVSAAASRAQMAVTVDMSKFTCEQLLEGTYDSIFTAVWISGYFNGTRKTAKLDLNNLKHNAELVGASCKSNPKQTVMETVSKLQSHMR
jgi:HdeA/HdeB family protein